MNTRLINLINAAGAPRIIVVGDIILDSYVQGDTKRISPEAPIQVLDVNEESNALGGAANVAANLKNLGVHVELCGIVGDDYNGNQLQGMLEEKGIGISSVIVDKGRPTINKQRVVAQNQQLVRIDREVRKPLMDDVEGRLFEALLPLLKKADMVVLSDYAKGVLSPGLIEKIVEHSPADVLADPKGSDYTRYKGCRMITPNRLEAETATRVKLTDMESLDRAARVLFDTVGLKELTITLGRDGIYYAKKGGGSKLIPARARSVYDVTGAGDTVISFMAFCLAGGIHLDDAVRIANAAAGIVVGKLGVVAPTRKEIIEFFSSGTTRFHDKVMDRAQAVECAESIRGQGETLVFTNGCFDLIHAGHVDYLRKAKALGDYLMVGVNDDDSIRRLKGPKRPIMPLDDRTEVLASLQIVDFVVPFPEDTPAEIVEALTPNILVKGEDWKDKGVVGREWVESHGGEVILISLREGCSTTGLINLICERYGGAHE